MEGYVTEEQQWEAVKAWFKKYGDALLWGLVIAFGAFAGIKYWMHHQAVIREEASAQYFTFTMALEKNDEQTAKSTLRKIVEEHPHSAYASLGTLVMAKINMTQNNLDEAKKQLQWVREHGAQADIKSLATVRLMRLLISQGKGDEALSLYDEKEANGYLTLMAEMKGDILLKQKNRAGAMMAYRKAYEAAPSEGMHGPLLKMKCDNLGIELNKEKSPREAAA
jgi:predicted negative regulator of RcsB-dependent stress response